MSVFTAVVTGTVFFVVLSQKVTLLTTVSGILMSFAAYVFTRPSHFEKFPILVFKLAYYTPKAIFESLMVMLSSRERKVYEIPVKDEWEELEKTLTITLTPRTLVVVSDEGYIVVHRVGRE
ncbi:Na+/H+ antiporter subunit E [Thermotoga sp.]|uniref:Na+/H+ antiporter subunit E n=1 Tax=Thermotoga sp. TaxID=28240 RepID=UPI0025E54AA9|nr:Na+/H+ antiporter subunit E [Thermotoga sp.]MCD6551535.1 Na+/H+ antiporter subunit E [Thermotoga sp.]